MARQRKQFLLRIPQELYDIYEAWAADEFRSVNAQMEAVLVDAARRSRTPAPTAQGQAGVVQKKQKRAGCEDPALLC